MKSDSLPPPDEHAQTLSRQLAELIRNEIGQRGAIPFSRYMERALYEPGLGYYAAGNRKFGKDGDFITAPEVSPLFSHCLARQCQQVLSALAGQTTLLELGAGSGTMAAELLAELDRLDGLPARYQILEVSADLRERQQRRIEQCPPAIRDRVEWLDRLPETPIHGCIIGNEVLDALPVSRFVIADGGPLELRVAVDGEVFCWQRTALEDEAKEQVHCLLSDLGHALPAGFCSEWCPSLTAFVASLADVLARGVMLFTDYGLPRREYYMPERASGTLTCHYRHRVHDDVFWWPGLQDLTAWVDLTALARAARRHDLAVAGYTTQAHFLLALDLHELLERQRVSTTAERLRLAQQVKTLTLPGEMGERFKAIAFSKNLDLPLRGFGNRDFSDRLQA